MSSQPRIVFDEEEVAILFSDATGKTCVCLEFLFFHVVFIPFPCRIKGAASRELLPHTTDWKNNEPTYDLIQYNDDIVASLIMYETWEPESAWMGQLKKSILVQVRSYTSQTASYDIKSFIGQCHDIFH